MQGYLDISIDVFLDFKVGIDLIRGDWHDELDIFHYRISLSFRLAPDDVATPAIVYLYREHRFVFSNVCLLSVYWT